MTIWLLTLLLLASLAGLGYRQGVVRVAFSLIGILLGALLAVPLGHLLRPALSTVGLKNPVLSWLAGPTLVFILVMAAFKIAAIAVHRKVDVYFKYKAGDLRLALWERLDHRLGLCLGLVNGTAYLILLSFILYVVSYGTVQMANGATASTILTVVNRLGEDLDSTQFVKVARAIDSMPPSYYEAADVAGMIFHTPELQPRLARYPAFLGLSERPEFQDLANDPQFRDLRQKQAPIKELVDYPKVQTILNNPDLLKVIWTTLQPNLQDLTNYLATGQSQKFDSEKLLGRWDFDLTGAMGLVRKARPNLTATQANQIRSSLAMTYGKVVLVATPEHQAYLKNFPRPRAAAPGVAPTAELQTVQGEWNSANGKYEFTFMLDGKTEPVTGEFEGNRLNLSGPVTPLALTRED